MYSKMVISLSLDSMLLNNKLIIMKINEKLVRKLENLKYHISFAESMTGGLLSSKIVDISGASNVLEKSFVTYSNKAKVELLNVCPDTIEKYDVVSIEVAKEMVLGLYNITKSEVCASVTGYAEGYIKGSGKFCYAIKYQDTLYANELVVEGSRNQVRKKATDIILKEIYEIIKGV